MNSASPQIPQLLSAFQKTAFYTSIISEVSKNKTSLSIKTLSGSLKAVTVASLWQKLGTRLLVVTNDDSVLSWYHDLIVLLGEDNSTYCKQQVRRKKSLDEGYNVELLDIVDTVTTLERNPIAAVVCSPESFLLSLPKRDVVTENLYALKRDQHVPYEEFQHHLLLHGFERQDYVSKPGDISIRGGIVDVFPIGWSTPLRIEFWGDTIESIREFDPLSQRSIREHTSIEFVAKYFHEQSDEFGATLLDYIDENTIVILDEPEQLESVFEKAESSTIFHQLRNNRIISINPFGNTDIETRSAQQPNFESSVEKFFTALGEDEELQKKIFICAEGTIHTKRIRELIENVEERYDQDHLEYKPVSTHKIHWANSTLHSGFRWDDEGIVCYTEHQVFNRQRFRDANRHQNPNGITLRELQQLRKGDLIVHIDKGVGQFDGLETITIGGSKQETIRLIFAEGDVLYVHLNYVNKLQRYSSQEGVAPKLSKLGSGEWERKKARTKKKIKDIARELIKLYALRKSQRGFAFPTDTVWQKEFEASFMYEDTPDQARATAEVKHDMESDTPMDRLVCGDVGFGKTEVAIRAAFKAAQGGKQVAVLVPTTILAHQHHITFSERLKRYPVKVDVISRFRSTDEQKSISNGLEAGTIDILIGTHRILSKDMQFKNLGLLIIDEEQRFGVGAKEKLRQLRTNIDTLTLTATPIPRTLNFSLMGARDLSNIETPPRNRLPIDTNIIQWDDDEIRKGITRELERGGQLYFVNDKIENLDAIAMQLTEIVPGLRFGIAHGQMDSSKLETVMERFLERKFDVLLATKIVESGLDIPNVNTIFINRADRFGLAELYQLRGRVGRSTRQAYCYLIVPPVKTLNRIAIRRLQAIEEHTDLGSGFHLAMRDLEIRGAGNLLGGEQSGFIAEMGFELYQKILDEAVQELRQEEFSTVFQDKPIPVNLSNDELSIELDTDALLPDTYIPKDTERFEFYKKLYNADSEFKLNEIVSELRDRYGALPKEAEELLFAVRLRMITLPTGFVRVIVRANSMSIELPESTATQFYEKAFTPIASTVAGMHGAKFLQKGKKGYVEIMYGGRDEAINIMEQFARVVYEVTHE